MNTKIIFKYSIELLENINEHILNAPNDYCICYIDLNMEESLKALKIIKDKLLNYKGQTYFKSRNLYSFRTINNVTLCTTSSNSLDACRGRTIDCFILDNFNKWKFKNIDYFLKCYIPMFKCRKNTSLIININPDTSINEKMENIIYKVQKI